MQRRDIAHTFAVLVAATSLAACTSVKLKALSGPGEACTSTDECEVGLECVADVCVVEGDVSLDITPDLAPDTADADASQPDAEVTLDVPEDVPAELPDAEPDLDAAPDADADAEQDADADADADAEQDADADAEVAPDADPDADADSDADADTTPDADAADAEVEVEVDAGPVGPPELGDKCTGACAVGLVCVPKAGGTATCELFPGGVCKVCDTDADCPVSGAKCLTFPAGGKYCGSPCGNNSDCLSGFVCTGNQCRPDTASCECTAELVGFTLGCVNQNDDGLCRGAIQCQLDGWSKCSAQPPSTERCDNIDNDCNGITDEIGFYLEKGALLKVGVPCGVGACKNGEVVCAPDGTGTCSTNLLATPESCADNVDNDCDGKINEDCASKDFDGDGVLNQDDCRPYDSAFHTGAPEACCPPGPAFDPECDKNCDGATTPCAGCDADFDGACPPQDCNDGDPSIRGGIADKCNDGIDQDCVGGDLLCSPAQDGDKDGYIPPGDCNDSNPAINPGAPELCDNLDNDCDGTTDEGNPQAGQPCGTTSEYCQSGNMVCTHYGVGAAIQCQGAILSSEELCDGVDNNCNGMTDEIYTDFGKACDGPDVDACKNGVSECSPDGFGTVCGAESITNLVELCNDLDDDCDGATDEFACPLVDLDGDGFTVLQGDCDDFRAEVHPGATEPCCDPGLGAAGQTLCDWNCNNVVAPCQFDADADGYSTAQGDCDDEDSRTHPGAPEKCGDGKDQDCVGGDLACAGVTDNDFDGFHSGIDCNDNNTKVNPWANETCNFIDDDCDGTIDEGNPTGKIGACGPDVPECTPGAWVCIHDPKTSTVQVTCVNENFQAPESCNELDDDCDGAVDETFFDLGLPCDGGDGDECENGALVCNDVGDGLKCGVETIEDIPERCDIVDNDCDGSTDEELAWEGNPLGGMCDGTGECGTGFVICNFFAGTTCSTNPDGPFSQAKTEKCNSLDDDCDGLTDEDFLYEGAPVGDACEGIGKCGVGLVECAVASSATCSTNPDGSASQAVNENCNGDDDDCDFHIDEGLSQADSSCPSVGVCAGVSGLAKCQGAKWVCDFGAVPGYEASEVLCDGLDNDCDGGTDEIWPLGQPCDGPDSDSCTNGTFTCAPSKQDTVCANETIENIAEVCNGQDDDCDGQTDEVQSDPGGAGCNTAGVCSLTSAIVVNCTPEGLVCSYSGIAGYQVEESLCDTLDNDCDGSTDEGLTIQGSGIGGPCEGKGACGQGVVQCNVFTKGLICSTEAGGASDQSVKETCNGKDDDCDGKTDEDFKAAGIVVGEVCQAPGVCGMGVVECATVGEAVCSTAEGGSEYPGLPEDCNGQDDDCDGQTDEPADLDTSLAGCKQVGVCGPPALPIECVMSAWQCDYAAVPKYQAVETTCDELDNDCDGQTDDQQPAKGFACDSSDADKCARGTWTCNAVGNNVECVNETVTDIVEICDDKDNDCDGAIDEGMLWSGVEKNLPCDGVGQCGFGFVVCDPTTKTATCSTNPNGTAPQGVAEACNGLDDDCDGQTDDGITYQGLPIGGVCDGIGGCGAGLVECSPAGSQPTCSSNPNGSNPDPGIAADECDGADNDCDSKTDEAFSQAGFACDGNDTDLCKTGTRACVGGAVTCQGDSQCPPGTQCTAGSGLVLDKCTCFGAACSAAQGNSCNGTTFCRCDGGPACVAPKTCVTGFGCQ
jgi:Notch-like protein